MIRTRVGVLRGGLSGEHEVSLKTGEAVINHLPLGRYHPVDVVIDKYNTWYVDGVEQSHSVALSHLDVVFNALHGWYGEDGRTQRLLNYFGVPYTGAEVFASALGMNKPASKDLFFQCGLRTPKYITLKKKGITEYVLSEVYRVFPQPSVVKPAGSGSSLHVYIAKSFNEFVDAVCNVLAHSPVALVEEFIHGREATCGVIENFRGKAHYALPTVEIIPPEKHDFFNYEAKYAGYTQEICPSRFSPTEKKELERMAILAHTALGVRHYSRSDFIVSPRGIYILETNTLPGLTPESLFPKAARAIGLEFPQFLDHVLTLAQEK